ncbi:flavoprotein [Streptomyces griseiscabiei]|uniref:Flavoprotein n=1 Tax=Streptomyces griseiscabiei TaxID=2993540 RepID=A0ABU4L4V0_9ACTN|nr:flavoprotein [Streptomyces griseiscabiei]MBZ3905639.1 flavoprotein [Streptomyces griseiscabiei]MDX2910731.1 flavoprotein [Streptomyces griseiscabiei]
MTATENTAEGPSAPDGRPFLYVVVCAAGIAVDVSKLITAAQERDWEVGVFATPVAMGGFFDTAAVEAQTGRPIRSAWRRPGDPRPFPPPDAVVVAPATFNTVNKWAAGLADTLVVGTLCEANGLGVPIAVLPCVADALAAHPAYRASLERLRGMGVRFGDPYAGEGEEGGGRAEFRWERALDLLDADGAAGAAVTR